MAFEQIVRGGGLLTQPFGATDYARGCRCEWNCPSLTRNPSGWHAGIDIAAGAGAVLTAVGYGRVVLPPRPAGGCGGLGPNAVCVRSGGVDVWYGHCSQRLVGVGQQVGPGQALAVMGSLGCSTGRHVHFEVEPASDAMVSGCRAIDPWAYISRWPGSPPVGPPPPAPTPPSATPWLLLGLAGAGLLLVGRGAAR